MNGSPPLKPWEEKVIKVLGHQCPIEHPGECGPILPSWWVAYVGFPCFSALCSLGMIIHLVVGSLRRSSHTIRTGPQRLMTSLMLMVALVDFVFSMSYTFIHCQHQFLYIRWQVDTVSFWYLVTHLAQYLSHILVALNLYWWTVRKTSPAKLRYYLPKRLAITYTLVFIFSASVTYWFHKSDTNDHIDRMKAAYTSWGPLTIILVGYLYIQCYRSVRDAMAEETKHVQSNPHLVAIKSDIRSRLLKNTLVFVVIWGLDSVFQAFALWARPPKVSEAVYILVQKGVSKLFKPLVGFYDVVAFYWRTPSRASTGSKPGDDYLPSSIPSLEVANMSSLHSSLTLQPRAIFATTYNMGGATSIPLTQLAAWVPLGYDMYAFGVQECVCLAEFKAALLERLGGEGMYRCFSAEIGDSTILHGKIAILFFGRVSDVESGALKETGTVRARVHNGVNLLGISRAANKGMVGLSFRYHDTTLALIAAHYAADKKGESGSSRRLRDARKTLREMVLVSEETEYDVHLQCHHVIILGDLNFRVQESPEWVLHQVKKSINWEIQEHKRMWGDATGGTWRDARASAMWRDRCLATIDLNKDESTPTEDGDVKTNGMVGEVGLASTRSIDMEEKPQPPMSLDHHTSRKLSQKAWSWLLECDELMMAMRDSNAFSGFREQTIRFPPSFKWVVGADAKGFNDVDSIPSLYKLKVKEKGAGHRPPSYTDRILVHSLPDQRSRLTLGVYDMVEGVLVSDHRPVALTMRLLVQPSMYGFDIRDSSSYISKPPSIYRCEIGLSVLGVHLLGGLWGEHSIKQFSVHYPLVSEDPLASQRKAVSVHELLMGDSVSTLTKRDSTTVSMVSSASTQSSLRVDHTGLKSHFHYSWSQASAPGKEVRFTILAAVRVSNHALVKLEGRHGKDMGQGAICLSDIWERLISRTREGGSSVVTSAMSNIKAPPGEPLAEQDMTIDLCVGGVLVGALTLQVVIHKLDKFMSSGTSSVLPVPSIVVAR